jgi:hypothetical protein
MAEVSKCHFFLGSPVFTQSPTTQAFGPVNSNEFRLTNLFSLESETMAYAICKGIILIQPQIGSTDKVNLILRPYKQPIPGLNIKYFIYRSLEKSDFFNGSNILQNDSTTSDFINKINSDFQAYYSPNETPAFSSSFIGYNENTSEVPLDTLISDFFFKQSDTTTEVETFAFELPLINEGKSLGRFANSECGIDVVLHYGDYKNEFDNGEFVFDLNYARAASAKITLQGTPYEKALQKEQISQFVDIAAFYGSYVPNGKVDVHTSSDTIVSKTGLDIYTSLLPSFATKNNWYIYIHSDRNRSYDFYGNYKLSDDVSNVDNIKIGNTTTLSENVYGTNGWPLLILSQQQTITDDSYKCYLQLVTDNNVNTILYGQIGEIKNSQNNNFCNAENLLLPPDNEGNFSNLTKVLELQTKPESTGTVKPIANLSILLYQGVRYKFEIGTIEDENNVIVPIYAQPNYFDDVFSLIHAEPLLKTSASSSFSKMTSEKLQLINHYFNRKQQGISAVQTLTVNDTIETDIEDTPTLERVSYITETIDLLNNAVSVSGSKTPDSKTSASAGDAVSNSKTYKLPEPYYYTIQIFTDETQTITGLELKTFDGSSPSKIILGLTKTENDSLRTLINNTTKNSRLFLIDLFNDDNILISPENIEYQKYKVGFVYEDANSILKLQLPETDIFVYSTDRKFHFSKKYSENMRIMENYNSSIIIDNALTVL